MATSSKIVLAIFLLISFSLEISLTFRVPLHAFTPSIAEKPSDPERNHSVPEATPAGGCPWCQGHIRPPEDKHDGVLTEREIKQIRLELVKAKILSRLDLTEVPKGVMKRSSFPSLVTEGKVPGVSISDVALTHSGDYPLPFILVADSRFPCSNGIKSPSSCFKFSLAKDFSKSSEKMEAKLWLWKLPDKGDGMPQMITVSQFWHSDLEKKHRELLISYHVTNATEGWISMNISWSQTPSHHFSATDLYLRISCPTCTGRRHNHPIASSLSHRPFLVIKERNAGITNLGKTRQKRSSGECSHDSQRCCRDSLYVDFAELGWSNWILQPSGFTMFYCKGSCANVTISSANSAGNTYSGLLQTLMLRPHFTPSLRRALAPCCSPGHKEPLSILWVQNHQSYSVRVSVLQDMIVTACDCFG